MSSPWDFIYLDMLDTGIFLSMHQFEMRIFDVL